MYVVIILNEGNTSGTEYFTSGHALFYARHNLTPSATNNDKDYCFVLFVSKRDIFDCV